MWHVACSLQTADRVAEQASRELSISGSPKGKKEAHEPHDESRSQSVEGACRKGSFDVTQGLTWLDPIMQSTGGRDHFWGGVCSFDVAISWDRHGLEPQVSQYQPFESVLPLGRRRIRGSRRLGSMINVGVDRRCSNWQSGHKFNTKPFSGGPSRRNRRFGASSSSSKTQLLSPSRKASDLLNVIVQQSCWLEHQKNADIIHRPILPHLDSLFPLPTPLCCKPQVSGTRRGFPLP